MTERSKELGVDQEGSTARTEAPSPNPLEYCRECGCSHTSHAANCPEAPASKHYGTPERFSHSEMAKQHDGPNAGK